MKKLLKELKGKICEFTWDIFDIDNGEVAILEDFDYNLIKIRTCLGYSYLLPYSGVMRIAEANPENVEKYLDYVEKAKNDPSFQGDYKKEDKGYIVIKRKRKDV